MDAPATAVRACALVAALVFSTPANAQTRGETLDLVRARELDQYGVRAFREGHYRDAIRFFTEAYKLGAPSTELWNIAKCDQKLDEPEEADAALERYLAQGDLSVRDRADATRELQELRRLPSTLSIDSVPSGARILIDGKRPVGNAVTPLTIEVAPGKHHVRVDKEGTGVFESDVEARYGRAILVDAKLDRDSGSVSAPTAAATGGGRPFSVGIEGGVSVPRLGAYADSLRPAFNVSARYAFVDDGRLVVFAGLRIALATSGWSNTIGAPSQPVTCSAPLPNDFTATELAGMLGGGIGLRLSERVRLGGDLGVGLASLFADRVGGDVFEATCSPSFGVKPAFHAGTELSFRVTPALRLVLSPLAIDLHTAFNGARSAPVNAAAIWFRVSTTLGLGVDF
ncbi:MAG: PEGA domain-containing protein [Polyangiaceae bacterium]